MIFLWFLQISSDPINLLDVQMVPIPIKSMGSAAHPNLTFIPCARGRDILILYYFHELQTKKFMLHERFAFHGQLNWLAQRCKCEEEYNTQLSNLILYQQIQMIHGRNSLNLANFHARNRIACSTDKKLHKFLTSNCKKCNETTICKDGIIYGTKSEQLPYMDCRKCLPHSLQLQRLRGWWSSFVLPPVAAFMDICCLRTFLNTPSTYTFPNIV